MNRKTVIGIILMVLGLGLGVVAILMVTSNLATTGPAAGKINSYKPPFENHGLLALITGFSGIIAFLGGAMVFSFGRRDL